MVMKILLISHAASLTGAPKFIFELAKLLADKHHIILVTKQSGKLWEQELETSHKITAHELLFNGSDQWPDGRKRWRFRSRVGIDYINFNNSHEVCRQPFAKKVEMAKAMITQIEPELVYVNSVASSEWVVASRLYCIRNVFHIHEMKTELMSQLLSGTVTLDIMDYADQVICPSSDVRRDVIEFFDSPSISIQVMEHFFDCDSILRKATQEDELPKNAKGLLLSREYPVICGCGVASERKGVDIFFETACQLPNLQFLWIGQWQSTSLFTNPVEIKFTDRQLDNFFITRQVSNPYFYLNLATVFVLSSREDPKPLVVFEGLILGKQVVCFSKAGGSRFVLDQYGYVISGHANSKLLVSFLERLFAGNYYSLEEPGWVRGVQNEVIYKYDKSKFIDKLERILSIN